MADSDIPVEEIGALMQHAATPELREAVLWAVLRPEERRREIARRALAAVLPPVAAMGLDPRWVVPRWARRGRRV